MNLEEIIKTKFLPPTIKYGGKFGISETVDGWCSYIQQCGEKYWATNRSDNYFSTGVDRKILPSKKEAIRRCWQHFLPNKDYYPPQETLSITKD